MSTDELRSRVAALILRSGSRRTAGEIADDILSEIGEAQRLGPKGNMPPEELEPESEEDRLLAIDPEHLMQLAPAQLPRLFDVHYPSLAQRGLEMREKCKEWQAAHRSVKGALIDIRDDDENAELSDLMVQLDDFADEVEETRRKVKADVYESGLKIDGWFKAGLVDPVMEVRGVTRTVSGKKQLPGPGTMQFAQTKYLNDKVERERQELERQRQAAEAEAQRKAEEARLAAEQEAERARALQREGIAPEEARDIAEAQTDQASEEAESAQQTSALIGSYAAAPAKEIARQHTASGTTVGLRGSWEFELLPGGMIDLCLAAAAPALMRPDLQARVGAAASMGPAAVTSVLNALAQSLMVNGAFVSPGFLTTEDKAIRAAIQNKSAPLRECPGLRIFQNLSAQRRAGR